MAWVVDTDLLLDVATRDATFWRRSADLLVKQRPMGLLVCPITYVELAPVFYGVTKDADEFLALIGVQQPESLTMIDAKVAFVSWHLAVQRKQKKVERKRPVADVLIGAFALRFDGLMTRNTSDFRTLFPNLNLLSP